MDSDKSACAYCGDLECSICTECGEYGCCDSCNGEVPDRWSENAPLIEETDTTAFELLPCWIYEGLDACWAGETPYWVYEGLEGR
jgi:hypothetical protein